MPGNKVKIHGMVNGSRPCMHYQSPIYTLNDTINECSAMAVYYVFICVRLLDLLHVVCFMLLHHV